MENRGNGRRGYTDQEPAEKEKVKGADAEAIQIKGPHREVKENIEGVDADAIQMKEKITGAAAEAIQIKGPHEGGE